MAYCQSELCEQTSVKFSSIEVENSFIEENEIEYVGRKLAAILSRSQCVKLFGTREACMRLWTGY